VRFFARSSTITANVIRIDSVNGNITVYASKLPDPASGGTIELDAGATLNILDPSGGGPTKRSSIVANGNTINFISPSLFTFDFSNSNLILFGAGSGRRHRSGRYHFVDERRRILYQCWPRRNSAVLVCERNCARSCSHPYRRYGNFSWWRFL